MSACLSSRLFTSGSFAIVPLVFDVSRFRPATSCVWCVVSVTLTVPALMPLAVIALLLPLSFWLNIGVTPPALPTDDTPVPFVGAPTDAPALNPLLDAL
jgi:hypothetical protein